MPDYEIRLKQPEDLVATTGEAATRLGKSRYGVEKGFKAGRIPGFQDPKTRRIWILSSYLDLHDPLATRIVALERAVEDLTARLADHEASVLGSPRSDPTSDMEAETDRLRVELTTSKAINLELLAAAGQRDEADRERATADKHVRKAIKAMQRAGEAQRRSERHLRDAISQTQLPGNLT